MLPILGKQPLDSRLRGNDGRGMAGMAVGKRNPLSHVIPPPYVIPSVAEESKNLEMESRSGIADSSATLGMT